MSERFLLTESGATILTNENCDDDFPDRDVLEVATRVFDGNGWWLSEVSKGTTAYDGRDYYVRFSEKGRGNVFFVSLRFGKNAGREEVENAFRRELERKSTDMKIKAQAYERDADAFGQLLKNGFM